MENYKKGKNEEEPLERDKIPIANLPDNFLWMQNLESTIQNFKVRGGSKIRNLLQHAISNLPEAKSVVWTGFGASVGKAVTCAEILKRESGQRLYQITKICYRSVNEFWDPLLPELDQIVVKRKLPMVHILLSVNKLNEIELGYQAPGETIPYKGNNQQSKKPINPYQRQSNGQQSRRRNVNKNQ